MNIQIRDPGGNLTEGFRSETPQAAQPLTHMAESVISNIGTPEIVSSETGERIDIAQLGMDGYRDYRGVPVFGAFLWDKHQEIGLTSEIDVAEALSTYTTIRLLALAVLGITLTLSLGGVLFILTTVSARTVPYASQRMNSRTALKNEPAISIQPRNGFEPG